MNNPDLRENSDRNWSHDHSGMNTPNFTPSSSMSSKNLLSQQLKQREIQKINKTILEEEEENKPNIFLLRAASRPDKELSIEDTALLTVYELKKIVFSDEELETKNIRLILKGRLLKDEEKIGDFRLERCTVMHAFLSEKVERRGTTLKTHQSNHPQDNGLGIYTIRGFDSFRDYGIGEPEIIVQRVNFHCVQIFRYKDESLDNISLLQMEEDWIAKNIEFVSDDPYFFPNFDFSKMENEKEKSTLKHLFDITFGIFMGFLFFLLPLVPKFTLGRKSFGKFNRFYECIVVGCIMKIIFMTYRFMLFEENWKFTIASPFL